MTTTPQTQITVQPYSSALAFDITAYCESTRETFLKWDEEARVIEAARTGNQQARHRLVAALHIYVIKRALRLANFYLSARRVFLDPQDIAQEAMLRAWKRLDKALSAPNPIGYLLKAVEGAMLTFCKEWQSMVRVPCCMQSRGVRLVETMSLDALLDDDGDGDDEYCLANLI